MLDLTGQVDTVDSISAAEWNDGLYQELKNVVTPYQTLDLADQQQLGKAIAAITARSTAYSSGGSSSAYVLTAFGSVQSPDGRAGPMVIRFRPHTNSVAGTASLPTIQWLSSAAAHVVREDGTFLQAGDLSTTRDAWLRWDAGTGKWLLFNFALGAPVAPLPAGFISGLTMLRNSAEHGATPTNFQDVAVQPGRCRDAGNTMDMVLATSIAKRFDALLTSGQGNSQGGYPTTLPGRTTGTWYRFFLIGESSTGYVDAGFDLASDAAATSLIADYNTAHGTSMNAYRQLGWVRTTNADQTQLVPFMNDAADPNHFIWTSGVGLADWDPGAAFGTGVAAQATFTLDYAAPDTVAILDALAFSRANSGEADGGFILQPVGHPDATPSRTLHTKHVADAPVGGVSSTPLNASDFLSAGQCRVRVDGSRQANIRVYADSPNFYPFLNTKGFIFER